MSKPPPLTSLPDLFTEVIRQMPLGLYIWHLEDRNNLRSFRLVATNYAATQYTQVPMEAILGRPILECFPEAFQTDIPKMLAEIIRTGREQEVSQLVYGDARVPRSVFTLKAFALGHDCVAVVFQNITKDKEREETLRQGEEQYRMLFERSLQPAVVVDRDTMAYLAVNEAAAHLYGYTRQELESMTILQMRPPEEVSVVVDAFKKVVKTASSGSTYGGQWPLRRKDGTIIVVEILCAPVRFRDRPAILALVTKAPDVQKP